MTTQQRADLEQKALQAFQRDFPKLYAERPGQWVAYQGDGFLYCRGFIVALGQRYYEAVGDNPDLAVVDAECEQMCYISWHVHHERFGEMPPSGISRETCSNLAGWPDDG